MMQKGDVKQRLEGPVLRCALWGRKAGDFEVKLGTKANALVVGSRYRLNRFAQGTSDSRGRWMGQSRALLQ